MENKAQKNYQSIEPGTPSGSVGNSTPIVFCIHGNKFGVARCCEDLSPDHVHEGPVTFSGNLDTPAPNEDIHGSGGNNESMASALFLSSFFGTF